MAFPVTSTQRAAFLRSHEMVLTATAFRGAENLGEIPVIDASVSATYGTQGGRDARITVPFDVIDAGLLDPNSDQVIIRTGIPGVIEVPIFTGRVDQLSENSSGSCQVQLLSRGGELIRAQFEVPWAASPAGTQARVEMQRIINFIDLSWGVDLTNANLNTIPDGLVWETNPGQALDQLGQGASLIWQPDRVGSFVIYTNPYSIGSSLGATPVVTLVDGEDGVLVQVEKNTSRIGVFNSVTVVTERVNNTVPIRVTAKDNTPTSPTFWGGLFGKQNLVVKNQTPISEDEAEQLALRILRQSLALQRSFTVSVPDMPILDPGDVFTLWYRDVVYSLVAESIEYSTDAQTPTVISGRELMLQLDLDIV
jgi:hypothetical protein